MVKAIWIAVFALAACASEEPRGDDDDNDDDSVEPLDSGQPPEDAGSVDAPSPDSEPAEDASLACTSPGEDCRAVDCCTGSVCIEETDGDVLCADTCRESRDCMSGCCAPLVSGGASVCSPVSFCTASVDLEWACTVTARALCERNERCGDGSPGCMADLLGACCVESGRCHQLTTLTPGDLVGCITGAAEYPCNNIPVPDACRLGG